MSNEMFEYVGVEQLFDQPLIFRASKAKPAQSPRSTTLTLNKGRRKTCSGTGSARCKFRTISTVSTTDSANGRASFARDVVGDPGGGGKLGGVGAIEGALLVGSSRG
eukprot:6913977-Pyramimonas_sp.AAC.1